MALDLTDAKNIALDDALRAYFTEEKVSLSLSRPTPPSVSPTPSLSPCKRTHPCVCPKLKSACKKEHEEEDTCVKEHEEEDTNAHESEAQDATRALKHEMCVQRASTSA